MPTPPDMLSGIFSLLFLGSLRRSFRERLLESLTQGCRVVCAREHASGRKALGCEAAGADTAAD